MKAQHISLCPTAISAASLAELDRLGRISLFRPTPETLSPPAGENVGAPLYESDERYGPHRLIAVGVNRSEVRLGVHGDNEEFLIPPHGPDVKPLFLIVCHLGLDELRRRDAAGTLAKDDFTCLSMYPCPRGAEMFTMLAGTVHCEATRQGGGAIGCFYVTESRDLDTDWIELESTALSIE